MSINIVENGELKNISGINFDELSTVAKTGSYEDLLNKPDIPTKASDVGAVSTSDAKKFFQKRKSLGSSDDIDTLHQPEDCGQYNCNANTKGTFPWSTPPSGDSTKYFDLIVLSSGSVVHQIITPYVPSSTFSVGNAFIRIYAGGTWFGWKQLYTQSSVGSSTEPVYFNSQGTPNPISYTLGAACAKGVATTVASGNTDLITSGAVYTALQNVGGGASGEQGDWTPVINGSVSNVSVNVAKYYKVGKNVICTILGGFGQTTDTINSISGLPFPIASGYVGVGCIWREGSQPVFGSIGGNTSNNYICDFARMGASFSGIYNSWNFYAQYITTN